MAALGLLLAALGSLLVRLEPLPAALGPLLAPLGSLLVALEPLLAGPWGVLGTPKGPQGVALPWGWAKALRPGPKTLARLYVYTC